MKDLIQELRFNLRVDQKQFAEMLNVSPVTVNRWENGKIKPGLKAQKQLYEICRINEIDLADFLVRRELAEDNNAVFYHASRKGIAGQIEPKSRSKCDFGRGFYMGTDPLQPLTLVCNEKKPVFYQVEFNLSGLNVLNIEVGIDWAMLIAYYRGYMRGYEASVLYQKYAHMADGYDVITGFIANDKMYQVLTDFFEGRIMDTALTASLSALKLGRQYVAVTQNACNQIRILQSRKLNPLDLMILADKSEIRRKKGKALADRMIMRHRRDGRFFDEILKEVQ